MSTSIEKNLASARLALLEQLKGELMILMGVDINSLSKQELAQQLNEVGDVADAILEALQLKVVQYKDGIVTATIDVGEL